MKLVKTDRDVLSQRSYVRSENQELLEEFVNSGLDCAEVKDFTQSSSSICANSLRASIRRFHIYGVAVGIRKNRVYLFKK